MNTLFLSCLNTILTFIEIVALFFFSSSVFPVKTNNKEVILSIFLLIAAVIACYFVSSGITILKLGLITIVDSAWIKYTYRKHLVICIGTADARWYAGAASH